MSSYIIGFMVFAAFARAAREYKKSALAWGAIGLVSFFIPQYSIAFLGTAILRSVDAPRASILLLVGDLVASAMIAAWAYNKLMDRAIRELASLDAAASAIVPPNPDRH
jgi:MFS superfamily sulfate permease-like transporter